MRNKILFSHIFTIILAFTILITQSAFVTPIVSIKAHQQGSPVEITSWYTHYWNMINSLYSCRDSGTGCWVAQNYRVSAWLMSAQSVMIDSSWKEPQLKFWAKYMSDRRVNFTFVEVQVEGETTWDRIKYFGGTNQYWHQETIDLSAYSGKKIFIKFQYEPNVRTGSDDERGRSSRSSNPYNRQLFYVQGVTVGPKS